MTETKKTKHPLLCQSSKSLPYGHLIHLLQINKQYLRIYYFLKILYDKVLEYKKGLKNHLSKIKCCRH